MSKIRTGTLKMTLEVGALIRGDLRRLLKNMAFTTGVELNLEEDKGFLDSNFRILVKGEEPKLLLFKNKLEKMMEDVP